MFVAVTARPPVRTPSPNSTRPASTLIRRATRLVRQRLCGLHGHLFVLHSAPGRLSLRCFACGAETRGWTIDVRPAFRCAGPARARAASSLPTRPSAGPTGAPRPLRPAA
jgi:hypothetical protein